MHAMIEDRLQALGSLCGRHHVSRLYIFGSGATSRFDPSRSDLDFVVEFIPRPDGRLGGDYFGFKRDLEALFGRKVDLVEPGAVRNRFFREELEETKVPLYAA